MVYRYITADDLPQPVTQAQSPWLRSQLSEDFGHCRTDLLRFNDGLGLAYAHYQPTHDLLEFRTIEREQRTLTITIALEGQSSTLNVEGQCFNFVAGHSTVAAFSHVCGERRFSAGQTIRQLRLIADESFFEKYAMASLLADKPRDKMTRILFFGKHNQAVQRLALRLLHLHECGGSLLDTHIAALSLVSEHKMLFLPRTTPVQKIGSETQDKLECARDLILSQYSHALTNGYLCATIGLNERNLKEGFRALFGTTPSGMLTDIRMQKAMELLESGKRVSTVAYEVGYQHLSSFSAAFERYYKITPKLISKRL